MWRTVLGIERCFESHGHTDVSRGGLICWCWQSTLKMKITMSLFSTMNTIYSGISEKSLILRQCCFYKCRLCLHKDKMKLQTREMQSVTKFHTCGITLNGSVCVLMWDDESSSPNLQVFSKHWGLKGQLVGKWNLSPRLELLSNSPGTLVVSSSTKRGKE